MKPWVLRRVDQGRAAEPVLLRIVFPVAVDHRGARDEVSVLILLPIYEPIVTYQVYLSDTEAVLRTAAARFEDVQQRELF
jgi:hypothetical protein